MGLFGKKKEEKKCCCCNSAACTENAATEASASGVLVLGSGCAKCNELEHATVAALKELGMDASVGHITDFAKIASYGVMATPALVVDGQVVSSGKVLKIDEIKALIQKVRGES